MAAIKEDGEKQDMAISAGPPEIHRATDPVMSGLTVTRGTACPGSGHATGSDGSIPVTRSTIARSAVKDQVKTGFISVCALIVLGAQDSCDSHRIHTCSAPSARVGRP
jgi:hypothetical protein